MMNKRKVDLSNLSELIAQSKKERKNLLRRQSYHRVKEQLAKLAAENAPLLYCRYCNFTTYLETQLRRHERMSGCRHTASGIPVFDSTMARAVENEIRIGEIDDFMDYDNENHYNFDLDLDERHVNDQDEMCVNNERSINEVNESQLHNNITFMSKSDERIVQQRIQQKATDSHLFFDGDIDDYIFSIQTLLIEERKDIIPTKRQSVASTKKLENYDIYVMLQDLKYQLQIPDSKMDYVLRLIETIVETKCKSELILAKCYKTIDRRCNQRKYVLLQKLSLPKRLMLPIPQDIFLKPENVLANVKDTESIILDIEYVLAEALLNVSNADNFANEPDLCFIQNQRVYKDFSTGVLFEKFCKLIKEKTKNPLAVPLCIGITLDESTANSTRNKSAIPLCFYILNLRNADYKIYFLGYCPVQCHHSDYEFERMLELCGNNVSYLKKELINMVNRQLVTDYIYEVFKPLKQYEKTGFHAQVGIGENSRKFVMYPFVTLIIADTMQADKLTYTSSSHKVMKKCRLCYENNCTSRAFLRHECIQYRNTEFQKYYGEKLENLLRNQNAQLCDEESFYRGSDELKQSTRADYRDLSRFCKLNNIKCGTNKLFDLFEFQSSNGLINLFQATVPDVLHTFHKGIVEYVISWTLTIIQCVQNIDQTNFSSSLCLLDTRIRSFPTRYSSLQPSHDEKFVGFPKGISKYINYSTQRSQKSAANIGGLMSGGIESWKMIPMLYQMMFSIANCGDILPCNDGFWLGVEYPIGNITKIVLNALSSTLQVYFLLRSKCLTHSLIEKLRELTKVAVGHTYRLFKLKNVLIELYEKRNDLIPKRGRATSKETIIDSKVYSGIKLHLLEHLVNSKFLIGCDNNYFDTQMSEQYHKQVVKKPYNMSSKQHAVMLYDMAKIVTKIERSKIIRSQYNHVLETSESLRCGKQRRKKEETLEMDTQLTANYFCQQIHLKKDASGMPLTSLQTLYQYNIKFEKKAQSKDLESEELYLHPVLSMKIVFQMLNAFTAENARNNYVQELNEYIKQFFQGSDNITIGLLKHVKNVGCPRLNMKEFMIRCNPYIMTNPNGSSVEKRMIPEFSAIEMDTAEGVQLCQVLGILKIETTPYFTGNGDLETKYHILFIVNQLQRVFDYKKPNYLPFPIFKHGGRGRSSQEFKLNILHAEAIRKPSIIIPIYENRRWTWKNYYGGFIKNWNNYFYYNISYNQMYPMYDLNYDFYVVQPMEGEEMGAPNPIKSYHQDEMPLIDAAVDNDSDICDDDCSL